MVKEKLWSEASEEEKNEVRKIETKQKELKQKFSKGLITGRAYRYNLTRLIKKVDEVEKKFKEESDENI